MRLIIGLGGAAIAVVWGILIFRGIAWFFGPT